MEKREIANVFSDPIFDGCVDGEVLPMARSPKMTALTEAPRVSYTIRYSDLDYNRHCNSCKYLQAMLDAYQPSAMKGWQLAQAPGAANCTGQGSSESWRLDIHYAREVMAGEQTTIACQDEGNLVRYQLLNAEGLTSCSAVLTQL